MVQCFFSQQISFSQLISYSNHQPNREKIKIFVRQAHNYFEVLKRVYTLIERPRYSLLQSTRRKDRSAVEVGEIGVDKETMEMWKNWAFALLWRFSD
jgi:hypothetical protein